MQMSRMFAVFGPLSFLVAKDTMGFVRASLRACEYFCASTKGCHSGLVPTDESELHLQWGIVEEKHLHPGN